MATGILGTLTGPASLTYTPSSNAKVLVSGVSGTGGMTINCGNAATTSGLIVNFSYYVGAGQTLTVSAGSGSSLVVSTLEEV